MDEESDESKQEEVMGSRWLRAAVTYRPALMMHHNVGNQWRRLCTLRWNRAWFPAPRTCSRRKNVHA